MIQLVGVALATVFGGIAALHIRWAVTTPSGAAVIPTGADGLPLFRPGPVMTLAVAAALLAAAILVLGRSGVIALPMPRALYRVGAWGLGTVMLLRAIGDFNYIGLFKRRRSSRFAQLDTRIYSPLCAALAAGTFFLAMQP